MKEERPVSILLVTCSKVSLDFWLEELLHRRRPSSLLEFSTFRGGDAGAMDTRVLDVT